MKPIRALTLDLDDTLWPIAPAILRAEQALHAWLQLEAPLTASRFDIDALRAKRDEVSRTHAHIAHDFTAVRRESLRLALMEAGDDDSLADAAFEVFFAARHELEFYPEVEQALQRIACRYPLLALTNGNADIARTSIGSLFRGTISARDFGIGKPDPRIFLEACRRLDCAPAEVLHVGDDLELDVRGAQSAGLQTFWLRRGDCGADDMPEEGVATVACLLTLADRLGC
ncbi:FMN hydrolase / 5-amino-6-(5-phospho-D-ribitylamino)uracil phosphatase [Burkholderiaceae bacterium]|nr:FMN hydrolase / 5-amino-6-(5-phospho-D-ribitylamino)uracil phosphatase [Burkholderiaceae bacterium]